MLAYSFSYSTRKTGALTNFAKFSGKDPCRSLVFRGSKDPQYFVYEGAQIHNFSRLLVVNNMAVEGTINRIYAMF